MNAKSQAVLLQHWRLLPISPSFFRTLAQIRVVTLLQGEIKAVCHPPACCDR